MATAARRAGDENVPVLSENALRNKLSATLKSSGIVDSLKVQTHETHPLVLGPWVRVHRGVDMGGERRAWLHTETAQRKFGLLQHLRRGKGCVDLREYPPYPC